MELTLYVLLALAGLVIIILVVVKGITRDDEPVLVIHKWLKNGYRSLVGSASRASGGFWPKLQKPFAGFARSKKDGKRKFICSAKFLFGHPDIRRPHLASLYLTDKSLILYRWFYHHCRADIPLNKITDIKIEKCDQAYKRFTKSGYPMAGVIDDYFSEKPRKSEYIISIRWEDGRGIKHDTILRYRGWLVPRPHIRVTNIRRKLLAAKPSLDHPDYAGPRLVLSKPPEEDKTGIDST